MPMKVTGTIEIHDSVVRVITEDKRSFRFTVPTELIPGSTIKCKIIPTIGHPVDWSTVDADTVQVVQYN